VVDIVPGNVRHSVNALTDGRSQPTYQARTCGGLPLPGYALLESRERKTGKPRRTPVGDGRIGNQFWLVVEHGTKAGYVRNMERDPTVALAEQILPAA
jgi:hypothetical protein